jgi:hypothetical protein
VGLTSRGRGDPMERRLGARLQPVDTTPQSRPTRGVAGHGRTSTSRMNRAARTCVHACLEPPWLARICLLVVGAGLCDGGKDAAARPHHPNPHLHGGYMIERATRCSAASSSCNASTHSAPAASRKPSTSSTTGHQAADSRSSGGPNNVDSSAASKGPATNPRCSKQPVHHAVASSRNESPP